MSGHADEALAAIQQAVTTLAGSDLHALSGGQLTSTLQQLGAIEAQISAVRSRVINAIEADGTWATGGARSLNAWLRQSTGRFERESSRMVRESRALRDHLPQVQQALADGRIGPDHVSAIVRHATSSPDCIALLSDDTIGEGFLVQQAELLDAGRMNTLMKNWALRADPAAADRRWREDSEREELTLAKTLDGFAGTLWLGEANGRLLAAALEARAGRRSAGDTRTRAQRHAAALVEILGATLDSGTLQRGARIRPHLAVTAPLTTLLALARAQQPGGMRPSTVREPGAPSMLASPPRTPAASTGPRSEGQAPPAWGPLLETIDATLDHEMLRGLEPATFEDGTPIPHGLFAQLACESHLHRVIFGPESEILDVGREKRLFTPGQTRGIIARDRHCQYPGCTAPPTEGEIHHTISWFAHHGDTAVSTGILLCRFHHSHVHKRQLIIERYTTRWRFVRSDGTTVGTTPTAEAQQPSLC